MCGAGSRWFTSAKLRRSFSKVAIVCALLLVGFTGEGLGQAPPTVLLLDNPDDGIPLSASSTLTALGVAHTVKTKSEFAVMTAGELAAYKVIVFPDFDDASGLGTTFHDVIGVTTGGRVFLSSHDPFTHCEPSDDEAACTLLTNAIAWASAGSQTGLLAFDQAFSSLPEIWSIGSFPGLQEGSTGLLNGNDTDILASFEGHPIYAGLTDFPADTATSVNWGSGYHNRFSDYNTTLFVATETAPAGEGTAAISLLRESDTDGDGHTDSVDNCAAISNPLQEDVNENGVGDACELTGEGPNGEQQQTYTSDDEENEYRATFPGQTEPETFVLGFDQVVNTLICTVNFRIVLLAEEAPRLAKINAARAAAGQAPVVQVEYTTADHTARGYGVRYEAECQVDTNGDGVGDRQAIPEQDYTGVNIAFTFHGEIIGQFDIAQERTLHQDESGNWIPEADVPLDQYDRLLSEIAPVHLARSSCDCVGSGETRDLSWFIAVQTALEDPDGPGGADPGEVELVVEAPKVALVNGEETFVNARRKDGTFRAGEAVPLIVRLRNTDTSMFIVDPDTDPPTESGLVATVKRVIDGDVDANVALEGFLFIWGNDGAFRIDPWLQGYYSYVWQTVDEETGKELPPGKYAITIASKYTLARPFFIYLR